MIFSIVFRLNCRPPASCNRALDLGFLNVQFLALSTALGVRRSSSDHGMSLMHLDTSGACVAVAGEVGSLMLVVQADGVGEFSSEGIGE